MTDAATSEATDTATDVAPDDTGHDEGGDHGDDVVQDPVPESLYIKIAIFLAVLTAMEVAWPYIVDHGYILIAPLLILMAIKFGVIAAFFMHLKFDKPILTRVFYSGLALAVTVYVIALATFQFFGA